MVTMIRKHFLIPAVLCLSLNCPHLSAGVYTIYPIPQSVTESSQTITLTSEITVIYESGIDETVRNRAEEVFIAAGYRLTESSAPSELTSNLYVGCYGSGEAADIYLAEHDLPDAVFAAAPNKYDPYLLQVNGNKTFFPTDIEQILGKYRKGGVVSVSDTSLLLMDINRLGSNYIMTCLKMIL